MANMIGIISPQWWLLAGLVLSWPLRHQKTLPAQAKLWSARLLQTSVVLLGASLPFASVLKQSATGIGITALGLVLIFALGALLNRFFKLAPDLATLLTMGTAICGGSAIGALAPVIGASALAIALSMSVVFLLNAVAVYLFPLIGHALELSPEQFGTWAALAIHDTSSVVAAASSFGEASLPTATTLKLTRALWILPVTLCFALAQKKTQRGVKLPWFIGGFLLMSFLCSTFPLLEQWRPQILVVCKLGFALTMFLIGLTLNWTQVRVIGARPLVFGVLLWVLVSGAALAFVCLTSPPTL